MKELVHYKYWKVEQYKYMFIFFNSTNKNNKKVCLSKDHTKSLQITLSSCAF